MMRDTQVRKLKNKLDDLAKEIKAVSEQAIREADKNNAKLLGGAVKVVDIKLDSYDENMTDEEFKKFMDSRERSCGKIEKELEDLRRKI